MLSSQLEEHIRHMPRRFHTPGHAGSSLAGFLPDDCYRLDLSEVGDLDVLSDPSGFLKDAQQSAAKLYGVRESFFLVNGASVGITAAMLAALAPGDKVLLPRNVHRSVISGLILSGAEPVWMLPEALPEWGIWGAVDPEKLDVILSNPTPIKALILTSPTYEGIGSNIEKISKICRAHGVLLIIDEAHGALWPFSDQLPASAVEFDCDAVIQSLHKSGGSLTQSAIAHLPSQSRIDPACFQQALNTLQSTSPSYLLLASLDATIRFLASLEGRQRMDDLLENTRQLRDKLQSLSSLSMFTGGENFDPTKLYFTSENATGEYWGNRVEYDHGMPYEAASPYGVLYLANIGLQAEDFDYFFTTLHEIDKALSGKPEKKPPAWQTAELPRMAMTPREAFFAAGEKISRKNAVGRIAKETIVRCPPGIPVLIPGEIIDNTHLVHLPETVQVVSAG